MLETLTKDVVKPRFSLIRKPKKISFEEYLTKYDGQHAEWIDGEVIVYMSASDRHQDLVRFLSAILSFFVEENNLGIIRTGPMTLKLGLKGREPDVFFLSKENIGRLEKNFVNGAADLVIEIISPESRGRDRGDKFYEYEQAGVKEYWLIDYEREKIEFYSLDEKGFYQVLTADENNVFHSKVLDKLEFKVTWLWQEKLPTLLEVAKLWKLV